MTKILLAGESWTSTTHHTKGFDTFFTSKYEEGAGPFLEVMDGIGVEVDFMPNHVAMHKFPGTVEELSAYDLVILSDIGANTLNLPPRVFEKSNTVPNRMEAIKDYVEGGGSLLMVGGYLSFQGIQAMAAYRNTPVAQVLPVEMEIGDDREEKPSGVSPTLTGVSHPATEALEGKDWPKILGYHRLSPKDGTEVLAAVGGHPLLVVGSFGAGKTAAFASDMAPHWLPPEFLEWDGYAQMFAGLVNWLTDRETK